MKSSTVKYHKNKNKWKFKVETLNFQLKFLKEGSFTPYVINKRYYDPTIESVEIELEDNCYFTALKLRRKRFYCDIIIVPNEKNLQFSQNDINILEMINQQKNEVTSKTLEKIIKYKMANIIKRLENQKIEIESRYIRKLKLQKELKKARRENKKIEEYKEEMKMTHEELRNKKEGRRSLNKKSDDKIQQKKEYTQEEAQELIQQNFEEYVEAKYVEKFFDKILFLKKEETQCITSKTFVPHDTFKKKTHREKFEEKKLIRKEKKRSFKILQEYRRQRLLEFNIVFKKKKNNKQSKPKSQVYINDYSSTENFYNFHNDSEVSIGYSSGDLGEL